MSDASTITCEMLATDVAVLSLCAPDKSVNILTQSVFAELERHCDALAKRSDVAGLVLRSTKPGNFIAGADLREFVAQLDAPQQQIVALAQRGQRLLSRLAELPFPTVAAIDGACLGGGAELACWCDRRLMAGNGETQLGFPEVKLGLFPGWGGTVRLPRIVGLSNAVEMITGGEPVDARAAQAMGLADAVEVKGEGGRGKAEGSGLSDDPLLAAAIDVIRREQASRQYLADRRRWAEPIPFGETELGFLGATASAYIQQQTKGHYPAPLAALELMLGAAGVDSQAALAMEAESLAPLFGSPVNRGLLNVFFLREAGKKSFTPPPGVEPAPIRRVSVVGAGVMGQGIAAASVKRGFPVALGDVSPDAVVRGVRAALAEASYNKATKGPDPQRLFELAPLLVAAASDQQLAAADLVVEAVFENLDAKRQVFARLEPLLSPSAVLCSNTSTIPIAKLAEPLSRPAQFCGLHFFNPVRQMPLVEVIRGPKTADATVATAVEYARRLGKTPVVVSDGPGFLVNRVLMPYMNEALLLLEEGATIKQVDRAATSFGMPMGPIALYDTVGLDVAKHAGGVLQTAFPDRIAGSPIVPAMVAAGRLGKKVGRGFFDYGSKHKDRGAESAETAQIVEGCRTATKKFSPEQLTDRLLLPMLLEATRVLEDGVARSVRDVDLALVYGIGFPPFRGGLLYWADSLGAATILEKLQSYESLGRRFAPTETLRRLATTSSKFYEQTTNR
jgi:3-hydroxyacyl-CoA dehydrogenase/enoyl-CoA hydratase/3-hydroxybutyryl-CoA epimerase/3-hydroxyacyl-CoA dehydrogenase/enoyl-CoA hydratase/3-hydroxybutyryl-CoA epimerase/enoyl-CoA isomerase